MSSVVLARTTNDLNGHAHHCKDGKGHGTIASFHAPINWQRKMKETTGEHAYEY